MGKRGKKQAARPRNHLREWREFRHMSQEQLADAVKTDKSVISLIETGGRGLSDKWAHRLAPILRTKPGYLLDVDPNEIATSLLDIWAEIPDETKPQAQQILETFRRKASQ